MNFSAGLHSADSWLGSYVQPSSTLAVDVMVAALAAVVFTLLAMGTVRSILSGLLLGVALLGFAAFSVKNSLAFGMQERVEKALRLEANEANAKSAVEKQNANALGRHERHLSWLQAQYEKAPKGSKERRDLRTEIKEASTETVTIQVATVNTVMGDPEATAMAKKLGWTVEDYIFANQLALAILLVVGKMLGFGLSAALWPRPAGPSVTKAETSLSRGEAPSLAVPQVSVPVASVTVPELSADLSGLEAPERVVRQVAKEDTEDLERARKIRAVKRFIAAEMVCTSTPKDGCTADEVFQLYVTWTRENEPSCTMTQMAFGLLCSELNVLKARHRGLIRYAIRPVEEVPVYIAA